MKTARYWLPVCATSVGTKDSVGAVAPAILLKDAPPSVLSCHCTVGVGLPLAAAVNVAVWPAVTVWLVGWVVITGACPCVTVRVAALLVAVPRKLVNTARYSLPDWAKVAVNE